MIDLEKELTHKKKPEREKKKMQNQRGNLKKLIVNFVDHDIIIS